MPLSDELILQTQQAFRQLDALQDRLDRLSDVQIDVTADTSGLNADLAQTNAVVLETADSFAQVNDQVQLTADEYKRAVAAIEEGESAARAVAVATGDVAREADVTEDAYRRVAEALNLSEDQVGELAAGVRSASTATDLMEANVAKIARELGLSEQEARQFARSIRESGEETRRAASSAEGLATAWNRVRGFIIAAVAAFGVRGLVNQFNQAIDSTLALSESVNAVRVTFGEGADEVIRFAETAADAAGLATSQAQQLVVPIGALLRNFGFEAQAAGEAAVTLTQRAADLASVFNSEVPEALTAISAALRGESDPLERFGASINAARVEAFALAEGLAATKGEITDAIKVQARYGLILADTASAAGDFANTSDEAANRTRQLQAAVENARAGLGEALLPAFEAVLDIAPRVLVDVAAMSESFRGLASDAQEGASGVETLIDVIAGIPRGFGVISDILSAPFDALRAVGDIGAGAITGDLDQLDEGIDGLQGSVGDLFDSLQQRAILESFISDLKEGVDPALAFANAAAATARNNELTAESFQALARISGVSDDRLADAARSLLEVGEASGFTEAEMRLLRTELEKAREAAGEITPEIQKLQRFRLSGPTLEVARFSDAFASAAEQAEALDGALDTIGNVARDTGLSIAEVVDNAELFGDEIVQLVNDVGAADIVNRAFAESLEEVALATRFDFSDAVDEFDLLIEKTNEAGEKVPATVEEMLADLSEQADRFARLEAATTILEALGFDSLASELRQKGPEAADAAEAFVNDVASAIEAESLLDDGGRIGDDLIEGVKEALAAGDITPELLDLVSQFTSSQVQSEVLNAALATGNLFGDELQRVLNALGISIPVDVFAANTTGFTSAAQLPSFSATGGISGATTVVNQTNNFNTNPQPTADTNRIVNATSAILKGAQ